MDCIRSPHHPCHIKLKRGTPGHISSWIGVSYLRRNGNPEDSSFNELVAILSIPNFIIRYDRILDSKFLA
jgi:hypothetical protein